MEPMLNGVIPSPPDVRDYRVACSVNEAFAEEFTLPLIPVKNQMGTSSCVAFTSSEIVEYHNQKETGEYQQFSTEFIYGYRPSGYYVGYGMYLRDACKTLCELGDVTYATLPGNHEYTTAVKIVDELLPTIKEEAYVNHITSYARVYTVRDIKHALTHYGPVMISMKWYHKNNLIEGIYTYDSKSDYGYHCVYIYGWNKDGWLVQNSWGSLWGNHGRFILPFDFEISEGWSIIDDYDGHSDENIKKKYFSPFGRVIARIFNFVLRLFNKK